MKKIKNYIKPTSFVQKVVLSGQISIGETQVLHYTVRKVEDKRQPEVKVILSTDEEELEGKTFNYFTMAVHNSVLTLWANKRTEFSVLDVARVMVGDSARRFEKDSKLLKKVDEEIQKMAAVNIYMNLADERVVQNREYFDENGTFDEIDAPILPVRNTTVQMSNGYQCKGYRMTATPPFYLYSENTNQMDSINLQHNQMKLYRKAERFAIREYLYERILLMKVKSGMGSNFNRIDFDNICEVVRNMSGAELKKHGKADIQVQTSGILEGFLGAGLLLDWHMEGDPDEKYDFCYVLELNLEGVACKNTRINLGKGEKNE